MDVNLQIEEILKKVEKKEILPKEAYEILQELKQSDIKNVYRDFPKTMYYKTEWSKTDTNKIKQESKNTLGRILVFDIDKILNENFMETSKSQGIDEIVIVSYSKSYEEINENEYKINPKQYDDYIKLIKSLEERNFIPDTILYYTGNTDFDVHEEALEKQLDEGFYSIFLQIKIMLEKIPKKNIRLFHIYPFINNENWCLNSAISGFIKTMAQENPSFTGKSIQLEVDNNNEKKSMINKMILNAMLLEVELDNEEDVEIRYKDGNRYVNKIRKFKEKDITEETLPMEQNGVYIITGGTGELGFIFAKHLASKFEARLVLTGRSQLNEEKEKKIEELKKLGSEVIYIRADITKRKEVEKLILQSKKKFKKINGIIHSAGVIQDALIVNKVKEDIDKVIKPKVYGTVWLDEATKGENLDFLVLFSSTTGVVGNAGQCDYAYGNSFMNSFAKLRQNRSTSGKTLSINWPLWKDGGMRPDIKTIEFMRKTLGIDPLNTQSGIKAFEDGLRTKYPQIIVVEGQENKIDKLLKTQENINNSHKSEKIELNKEEKNILLEKTIEYLKIILSEEIKLSPQKISVIEPLENYGIDSVMTMNLNRILDKDFEKLSKTLFYEYQTIGELAEYFVENHQEKLMEKFVELNKKPSEVIIESNPIEEKKEELSSLSKNRFSNINLASNSTKNDVGEIAIIGLSGRYPMAKDMEEYWENLKVGKDCITEVPKDRWNYEEFYDADKSKEGKTNSKWGGFIDDVDKFDSLFFNISPKEAQSLDPQERLFLQTVWQTVEDAGYTKKSLNKSKVGVFVGVMYGHYQLFGVEESLKGNVIGLNSSYASIANRISYYFNFSGPSIAMDTMCSSSLTSIHLACESIRRGESHVAIAGGVNVTIHPNKYILLSQGNFLAEDGRCRSFGEGGSGYVPGEGVGAIILKPLKNAIEDGDQIYAVIKGTAVNHGGKTNGYTVPNPKAQAEVISETLKHSKINPRAISYLEAHGTGTSLGDPIEITGLKKAFEEYTKEKQYCSIGSVKSNIGHLESAAGIAGVAKILLQMKHKKLVPSIHSDVLNQNIDFEESPFYVQQELEDWKKPVILEKGIEKESPRIAGISSFGAGGSNAHIILEEYEESNISNKQFNIVSEDLHVIVLSAKNKERLKEYGKHVEEYISKQQELHIKDISYTLQVGREGMEERIALVVKDKEELIDKLKKYYEGKRNIEHLYEGNIKDYKNNQEVFIDEEDGKEFIKKITIGKKHAKLAQLWVTGIDIEWELLYNTGTVRRVSLPPYPFAEVRHWVQVTKDISLLTNAKNNKSLHPLIDSNESTLEEQCFKKAFTGKEFYTRDHVIDGNILLPGVVQLEMARIAGELANKRAIVQKLSNITWARPVVIKEEEKELYISLYPIKDRVGYEISTLGIYGKRIIYSQGEITYKTERTINSNKEDKEQSKFFNINDIKKRCSEIIKGDLYYTNFSNKGFEYGTSFQTIKEVYKGNNEVMSLIELPKGLEKEFEEFTLHPSLLDGALQTVAGLHEEGIGNYLPYSIGEISIEGKLSQSCYVYAKEVTGQRGKDKYTKEFNIVITDEQGQAVINIQRFIVKAMANKLLEATSGTKAIYCTSQWEEANILDTTFESNNVSHNKDYNIIVFDNEEENYSNIKDKLKAKNIILVKEGKNYRNIKDSVYEINSSIQEDYIKLMNSLKEENILPNKIIHMWSKNRNEEDIDKYLERGLYSIFFLTKAIMDQKLKAKIYLNYVYEAHPAYEGLSGFMKTVIRENPNFICKTIQMESEDKKDYDYPRREEVLERILLETKNKSEDEIQVKYKAAKRYVKRLKKIDKKQDVNNQLPLKENGVYMITGGTGGLGYIFAKYLANKVKARLVLTGRSKLNEEKEKKIEELKKLGSEVIYVRADVTVLQEVEEMLNQTKKHFKEINGVIHSAGLIHDSFIINKTINDVDRVLRPKVYGTLWIDEVTKNENLDFLVLFSSTAGVTGNAGQCDYAYGNSFMDSFAELRKSEGRTGKTISINWPLWKEGGMKPDEKTIDYMRKTMGIEPLNTQSGIMAFEDGLKTSYSQMIVVEGQENKISKVFKLQDISDTVENEEGKKDIEKIELDKEERSRLLEKVEKYLKDLLSDEIKLSVEKISNIEPLENYGLDSVMIMNLTRKLEEGFGQLSTTLFYEYQTIGELGGYFVDNHEQKLMDRFGKSDKKSSTISTSKPKVEIQEVEELTSLSKNRFFNNNYIANQNETDIEEIAIIGLSGKYPMAENMEEYWENLKVGKDCITKIPKDRWDYEKFYDPDGNKEGKTNSKWGGFISDVDKFDPLFFNISPREAQTLDPQERLFLQTVWKTIEDAGYTKKSLSGTDVGVFVGVMYGHYQLFGVEESQKGNVIGLSSSYASIANRISYYFNLNGPSIAMDTMCSSSLTAIHLACESIRRGESTIAIAGGVNVSIHPNKYILLSQGNFLAEDGRCRSFGEGGSGYVPGEGVGAAVLKPLKKAIEDGDYIYAVIKGSALNHGGKTNGYTVPNPNAQAKVISKALKNSKVNPRAISYLEAHGTGTSLGDPIEITGLKKAFEEHTDDKQYCAIGSVKANIGHLESAAGIAGIAKILLQMKHKKLVPSIHSDVLNPNIDFIKSPFYVQKDLEDWQQPLIEENGVKNKYPRTAGISSFGAGGANAHIILEEYEKDKEETKEEDSIANEELQIIVLSAKNKERLKEYAYNIYEYLEKQRILKPTEYVDNKGLYEDLKTDLIKIVSDVLDIGINIIDIHEDITEYGQDIFNLLEIVNRLNEKYKIKVPLQIFTVYNTLSSFIDYLIFQNKDSLLNHYPKNVKLTDVKDFNYNIKFRDIAYTLQLGRESMEERMALIVKGKEELCEKLIEYYNGSEDIEKLYTGNVRLFDEKKDILIEGHEGEVFLNSVISQKKLTKLAQLWVAGHEIDWNILYNNSNVKRISLPTYPFAKERCWIQQIENAPVLDNYEVVNRIHPLVYRNESNLIEQKFSTKLTGKELYLRDYLIFGEKVVSSSMYMEMARVMGSIAIDKRIKKIRNFKIGQPIIQKDSVLEIKTGIYPYEDILKCEFSINNQLSEKTVTAQAELTYKEKDNIKTEIVDIKALQNICTEKISGSEYYKLLEKRNMKYGQSYQGIKDIYVSNLNALSYLKVETKIIEQYQGFELKPSLIEGALQTALSYLVVKENKDSAGYMPIEVGEVELIGDIGNECYAYVEVKNLQKKIFTVKLLDLMGRVLVKMTDIKFTKVKGVVKELLKGFENDITDCNVDSSDEQEKILIKEWMESEKLSQDEQHIKGQLVLIINEENKQISEWITENSEDLQIITIRKHASYDKLTDNNYLVNFNDLDQITQVTEELLKRQIVGIVDLTDVQSESKGVCDKDTNRIVLLQELINGTSNNPFYILHFTRGLQTFKNSDPTLMGASVAGIVRMLGAEYSKVDSRTIDIFENIKASEKIGKIILQELNIMESENEVCYRDEKRYVQTMSEISSEYGNKSKVDYDNIINLPHKVVVITGSTRGIGAEVARHLVRKGVRKIVLMGLNQLPDRSKWDELITDKSEKESVLNKLRLISDLEKQGAEVDVYTGSLTHKQKLTEFFESTRKKMGEIGGVIHCAGLVSQNSPAFIDKDMEDINSVFEPKREGLHTLHEVFKNDKLEFFVLFSSVSALIPKLATGLSDYAAANGYMDYFASYQNEKGYKCYKSIVWPMWSKVGLANFVSPVYKKLGLSAITVDEGLAMLDDLINGNYKGSIVPCKVDIESFNMHTLLSVNNVKDNKAKIKTSAIEEVAVTQVNEGENMETKEWLKSLFSKELHIPKEKLDSRAEFQEFGIDSILLTRIVTKIEEEISQKIDPTIFLEYPTLEQVSKYLDENVFEKSKEHEEHNEEIKVEMKHNDSEMNNERKETMLILDDTKELITFAENSKGNKNVVNKNKIGNNTKIAVIGIGCNFPGANNKEKYWDNLMEGKSSIREVPSSRWDINRYYSPVHEEGKSISKWGGFIDDIEYFDPAYFNFTEEQAPFIDPLMRQFLEVSVQTVRDAGYEGKELSGKKVGVFVGSRVASFGSRIEKVQKNSIVGLGQNFIAAHVSHFLNLNGPSVVVDTACSSSLVSVHLACQSLMLDESEMAIAGGVDILLDKESYVMLSQGRALSPDGKCHTFDEKANGFVPGEGCGAVVLKKLDKAINDGDHIYAVIDSTAVNNDGRTMGITTPNPKLQSKVIMDAIEKADVSCDSISYVETHGTGTMIGDPIELKALTEVFDKYTDKKGFCGVGSVKTNFGHLLSAAGIASVIKVVLSLWNKKLPPTLNCETPNPRFNFKKSPFYPNTSLEEWEPESEVRRAGISSFGFGGTNIHAILSEFSIDYDKKRKPLSPVRFNKKRYWIDKRSFDDGKKLELDSERDDSNGLSLLQLNKKR